MKEGLLTVPHNDLSSIGFKAIKAAGNSVVFDAKGFLDREVVVRGL